MAKGKTSRNEFEESQAAVLLEQLQQRDWTLALLEQELTTVERSLADGDIPVLDETGAVGMSSTPTLALAGSPTEDEYAAFFDNDA